MTAASLAHLPLQVGVVALAQAGRAALWVVARYMRAPLTNTAIAALVVTSAMAGSNALFGQRHEHPSPLFAPMETAGEIVPVPKIRPKSFAVGTPAQPRLHLATAAPAAEGPIGNKEVFEVQRKLERLQLFTGTVDGYYGPQTARAIKKFQELSGIRPTGELDREIIELVLAAPLGDVKPAAVAPAPLPAAPAAVTLPQARTAPAEADLPAAAPAVGTVDPKSLAAIAAPRPLGPELQTGSIAATPRKLANTLLGRPVPRTPEAALEMAADTAGDAIDTIIDGVQAIAMNRPAPIPARQVGAQQFAPATRPLNTAAAAAPVALVPGKPAATAVAALPDNPQVGVPLKIEEAAPRPGEAIAVLDTEATPDEIMAPFSVTDPVIVAKVQRGLGSLGFLHGPADGVAGEATAKAIRNFEVYFNYKVTGRISPELLDLLIANGAAI